MRRKLIVKVVCRLLCAGAVCCSLLTVGCGGERHEETVEAGDSNAAQFTVLLAQYNFADALQKARALNRRARQLLRSEDVWQENVGPGVAVNYGHYSTYDKAEAALARVKRVYSEMQAGKLQFCYVREIPPPDPPAPDEWNLLNSDCRYTLEIGVYFNLPDKGYTTRKRDAVRSVRKLRGQSEEAFFVHGQHESRVCVGCFGSEVAGGGDRGDKQTGMRHPEVRRLLERYPFRYENSATAYDIIHDKTGLKRRVPRRPVLVDVLRLHEEIAF